jgi:alpha-galactosidase
MRTKRLVIASLLILLFLFNISCQKTPPHQAMIEGKNITIYFDQNMHSQVLANFDGKAIYIGEYAPSEYVTISGSPLTDFTFQGKTEENIQDALGKGKKYLLTGQSGNLKKDVQINLYDEFPTIAVYKVTYSNIGEENLEIESWTNNHYVIKTDASSPQSQPFWSFESGSYESRPDWVLPLKVGFSQQNYMGMNATDYGGGTPVVDVWRKDAGIGVGHLELVPKLASLPVNMPDQNTANLGVEFSVNKKLQPKENFSTFETFVAVHQGDYFATLVNYRNMMIKKGIKFDKFPDSAYEPIWCAWGFQRNFTIDQIYKALPEVKKLGYEWAVLDDGWQTAEGDWYLVKSKFPRGDADMKRLVDTIHSYGLKAKLWWAPLAVDPGTDLIKQHSDYLLLNKDGSKEDISWWNAYYLCPAYPPVQEYTKNLVTKIMKDWGYDGLKIDGQHLNGAPPCYNPLHHHAYPEESVEKIPEFFKVIYETARSINPNAVVEICPCGTAYAFHTMPYMNQPVASDPESSWQIRLKGKTMKALMGPSVPYYGDHVELSDGRDDFASTVGVGGVVGTKFTWPVGSKKKSRVDLTPEKAKIWEKWNKIYLENMLPKGIYLGDLYDIGFDKPEAHAILKGNKMYYAFYADSYKGDVELRGLEKHAYQVMDYENQKDYGTVQGPVARIPVEFEKHLLLEAKPE